MLYIHILSVYSMDPPLSDRDIHSMSVNSMKVQDLARSSSLAITRRFRPPAGAKYGWRLAWETMMKELAPQTKDGSYARPTYNLKGVVGSPEFPVSHPSLIILLLHADLNSGIAT